MINKSSIFDHTQVRIYLNKSYNIDSIKLNSSTCENSIHVLKNQSAPHDAVK